MTKGTPRLGTNLTLSERGYPVYAAGKLIGAVIRASDLRFVAWTHKRLGDFASAYEAESAVRAAARKKKAKA